MCEVLKIIAKESSRLCQAGEEVTVVAFFGEQQKGKSTTINALVHGVLEKGEVDYASGNVTYTVPKGREKGPVAESGTGMIGCTRLPYLYQQGDDLLLLDTRGFFDEKHKNEMVAATIMTEATLRRAKGNVKLVFLQRVEDFAGGLSGMQDFGKMYGKLVSSDSVPAMFLLNNWRVPTNKIGEEHHRYVKERIKQSWDKIVELYNDEWTERVMDIFERLDKLSQNQGDLFGVLFDNFTYDQLWTMMGQKDTPLDETEQVLLNELKEIILKDEEFTQMCEKYRYLEALQKAFEVKRTGIFRGFRGKPPPSSCVGYIEPWDDYSIRELRRQIREDLAPINVDNLDFSRYNDYTKRFFDYFKDNIRRFLPLLRGQQLVLKYPLAKIQDLIKQKQNRAEELQKQMNEMKIELQDDQISKKLDELDQPFSLDETEEEFRARIAALESARTHLIDQARGLRKEVHQFKTNPKPIIVTIPWCKNDFYPQERVIFPSKEKYPQFVGVPFKVKELVIESGKEVSGGKKTPPVFDVTFVEGNALTAIFKKTFNSECQTKGKVVFEIDPRDIPDNVHAIEDKEKRADDCEKRAKELKRRIKEEGIRRKIVEEERVKYQEKFEEIEKMWKEKQKKEKEDLDVKRKALEMLADKTRKRTEDSLIVLTNEISVLKEMESFHEFMASHFAQLHSLFALDEEEDAIELHYKASLILQSCREITNVVTMDDFISAFRTTARLRQSSQQSQAAINVSMLSVEGLEQLKAEIRKCWDVAESRPGVGRRRRNPGHASPSPSINHSLSQSPSAGPDSPCPPAVLQFTEASTEAAYAPSAPVDPQYVEEPLPKSAESYAPSATVDPQHVAVSSQSPSETCHGGGTDPQQEKKSVTFKLVLNKDDDDSHENRDITLSSPVKLLALIDAARIAFSAEKVRLHFVDGSQNSIALESQSVLYDFLESVDTTKPIPLFVEVVNFSSALSEENKPEPVSSSPANAPANNSKKKGTSSRPSHPKKRGSKHKKRKH